MMPGPLLTASIGYTLERGFWAGGPLLVLGHALLEAALVVLVLAGLGPVLARPRVGASIGVVGGAVLLWMGCGMLDWATTGAASLGSATGEARTLHPVLAGALISLANPYWSLWWATIGLKYIALSRDAGRSGVAAFFAGHEFSDVAWYFLVAGAVALGRQIMPDGVYRWLIGACGGVLLGFGLFFLATGVRGLVRPTTARPPEGGTPNGGAT
jgi:threonine/homoserine/homoserine lactone efflux protein